MQKNAILLALREESSALSLRDMLERQGYRTSVYFQEHGGVPEALFSGKFDLVLVEKEEGQSGLQIPASRSRVMFGAPIMYIIARSRIPSSALNADDIPDAFLFLPAGEIELRCAIDTAVRACGAVKTSFHAAASMHLVAESLPHGIVECGPDGAVTWCNQAFCTILGYSRGEIARMHIADFQFGNDPRLKSARGHAVPQHEDLVINPHGARFERRDGSRIEIQINAQPVRNEQGQGAGYIVIVTDITERRRADEAIREREELFRFIINQIPAVIWLTDKSLRFTGSFGAGKELLGLTARDITGRFMSEILGGNPDSLQVIMLHNRALAGESAAYEIMYGTQYFSAYAEPLRDLDGAIIGTIGMAYDMTDRKKTEIALKESEERLALAFEASTEGLWDRNIKTGEIYCSPMYYSMLGYAPHEFPSSFDGWIMLVHPDDRDRVLETIKAENLSSSESYEIEFRIRKKTGDWMWLRSKGKVVERDQDGFPLRSVGTHADITERKTAVDALKKSLEEKEVLLKEVHHRVKNNLQIISSIFSLQASRIPDTRDRTLFTDCQNRVRAIALVHEKLYQTKDFSHIDFSRYINGLVSHLLNIYGRVDTSIRTEVDIADAGLSLNAAIPCALIVNELISNSLKFAFEGRETGLIGVRMKSDRKGLNVLTVSDNGTGIPAGVDLENAQSMGLQLVHILALQIHASVDIERNGGTTFNFRFRNR